MNNIHRIVITAKDSGLSVESNASILEILAYLEIAKSNVLEEMKGKGKPNTLGEGGSVLNFSGSTDIFN